MRARATTTVTGSTAAVRAVVADLATWPSWLDVVARAAREPGDGPPAWRTRLGLRVGPVAVGFDVRMQRVVDEPDRLRFERVEVDGRDHSPVVIDVTLAPAGADRRVALGLDLLVDKRIPLLDLQREVDRRARRTGERLQAMVDRRTPD